MLRLLDYIFFQIYTYYRSKTEARERKKRNEEKWHIPIPDKYQCERDAFHEEAGPAIGIAILIFTAPICVLIGAFHLFPSFFDLPDYKQKTLYFLVHIPIIYRYLSKNIRKDDYKVFRDRWENEDPKRRRRNRWIILIACITNIIIVPIVIIVLQVYDII